MVCFVIFFTCWLLRAQDYCGTLDEYSCDYDFLCLWDGISNCDIDENAAVGEQGTLACGSADCTLTTYSYTSPTGVSSVVDVTYSVIKGTILSNAVDLCSLDHAIALDVYSNPNGCPTAGNQCDYVNFGTDANYCFDFCWANPLNAYCSTAPCDSGSGKVCCVVIQSYACQDHCDVNGTVSTCCGAPGDYTTTLSSACTAYLTRNTYTSMLALQAACSYNHSNLTACALCDSYYECCSRYKTVVGNSLICDDFCALKPSDADCEKRTKCLADLGHEPSEAELAKCGTSMVRLSSFTVAVLLGIMAFFFLV